MYKTHMGDSYRFIDFTLFAMEFEFFKEWPYYLITQHDTVSNIAYIILFLSLPSWCSYWLLT